MLKMIRFCKQFESPLQIRCLNRIHLARLFPDYKTLPSQSIKLTGGYRLSSSAGLPAGDHHLSGEQALVFVRDRQGSDDFFRMQQAQFFIAQLIEQIIKPGSWPRIPAVMVALNDSVDTNLPVWVWPRLGFALLRAGPGGIDSYILNRDYVSSTVTSEGAQVLIPQWSLINLLVNEIFSD